MTESLPSRLSTKSVPGNGNDNNPPHGMRRRRCQSAGPPPSSHCTTPLFEYERSAPQMKEGNSTHAPHDFLQQLPARSSFSFTAIRSVGGFSCLWPTPSRHDDRCAQTYRPIAFADVLALVHGVVFRDLKGEGAWGVGRTYESAAYLHT